MSWLDRSIYAVAPVWALRRKAARFAYDAVDSTRTRKKRVDVAGTGDNQLTEYRLSMARNICRDMMRNNPLVRGIMQTETDGLIGSGVKIEGRTDDSGWNKAAEELWREEMVNQPCDVTGRLNFNHLLRLAYLSYRRDGDNFVLFTDDGLQLLEGDSVGTPYGVREYDNFRVYNGVAISKKNNRVIGYYVGQTNEWGYVPTDSYQRYLTDDIHHVFNPGRITQSRGEPALVSVIDWIDKLTGYIDTTLIAAKVQACFTMFISRKSAISEWGSEDQQAAVLTDMGTGHYYEKMEPGQIMYGETDESAQGIGQTHPSSEFDPFVNRMLTFIGRPLCMPLMLVTLDYSGATFMNARIAYQECRAGWQIEQEIVVKPFVSRVWRWKINEWINRRLLGDRLDKFRHEVRCQRWPYVDPFREAEADRQQLENLTTTRTQVCARLGSDFEEEIIPQRVKEKELMELAGLVVGSQEIQNGQNGKTETK